jgi:hypothetical protein
MTAAVSVVALRILLEVRDDLSRDADEATVLVVKPERIPPEYRQALKKWLEELDQ